jgi:putative endonuclease
MYYVYALVSVKNSDLYIGYSKDLKRRFTEHNDGQVTATKGYRPWRLAYYEAYANKYDATIREKQLKMHKAKEDLKNQLKHSIIGT